MIDDLMLGWLVNKMTEECQENIETNLNSPNQDIEEEAVVNGCNKKD